MLAVPNSPQKVLIRTLNYEGMLVEAMIEVALGQLDPVDLDLELEPQRVAVSKPEQTMVPIMKEIQATSVSIKLMILKDGPPREQTSTVMGTVENDAGETMAPDGGKTAAVAAGGAMTASVAGNGEAEVLRSKSVGNVED